MPSSLPLQVLKQLEAARATIERSKSVVGFDGFVDTIIHVVDKRESATRYTRLASMAEFGGRITAAAGKSANFEMVPQLVKLGGNGPIMANALDALGLPVTYIGTLGSPAIHPVFADFARRAEVVSVSDPGFTDAVEFEDGKLMFGDTSSVNDLTWPNILKQIPEPKLVRKFGDASLIAMVNWTMLPHLTSVFRKILSVIGPKLGKHRPWVFFDLADPAKRTQDDLSEALEVMAKFRKYFRVILGLNYSESCQIGSVYGLPTPPEMPDAMAAHASALLQRLRIDSVVLHPVAFAAGADAEGNASVEGPFTPNPKITTGAGDHFNAGFCVGRILGWDLPSCLQLGVATSGFYVRNAKSPTVADLKRFLKTL